MLPGRARLSVGQRGWESGREREEQLVCTQADRAPSALDLFHPCSLGIQP